MRLVEAKVENLRCYRDEVRVRIGDLTTLIGKNDAGKSTILEGLAAFFSEQKLDKGDINKEAAAVGDPIRVTAVYEGFPKALVLDSARHTSLAEEHLLNAFGKLEVIKEFSGASLAPKVYVRANYPTAQGCGDLIGLKIADLKKRMTALGA